MTVSQRILVRIAVLAAVWVGWQAAVSLLASRAGNVSLGAGLLAFGTVVLVAAAGGVLDGRRLPLRTVLLVWSLSALGFAVVAGAWQAAHESGLETSALVADTIGTGVFVGVLVALPAVLGGVVGSGIRRA